MEELARKLISGTYEEFSKGIDTFLENYEQRIKFDELNNDRLRTELWKILFKYLSNPTYESVHLQCLTVLRILSRDKTNLNELLTMEMLHCILQNAELSNIDSNREVTYTEVLIESLKLLCNILYNSVKIQQLVLETECLPSVIQRISIYSTEIPHEVILFDLRILFLITALNNSSRNIIKDDLNGEVHLINVLKELLKRREKGKDFNSKNDEVILACEVLKVLFNLYIHSKETLIEKEEEKELGQLLYQFLCDKSWSKHNDLVSNIINLLTVLPSDHYSQLIPPESNNCDIVYQNTDLTAISVLLDFLHNKLNSQVNLIENLSPSITTLIKLAKRERLIRRYIRLQILPPLKDVMKRPEEGTTLRAKLCQLLTSPVTDVRDLVAEFLFVLCRENTSRMVKYTGYGNAAGMFANKGLLDRDKQMESYSSESEGSDTEEYLKYREQINPVTGCFEKPKKSPLDEMTEEQKEYEALKLIGLVDKLTRGGIVQPCRIGENGKPKPIEHVLELQELPKQRYTLYDSDSD